MPEAQLISLRLNFLQVCLLQGLPKLKRAGALLEILIQRHNNLVPKFLTALRETGQTKVLSLLGLDTFVALAYLVLYI